MAKRVKPKQTPQVKDWQQADKYLRTIGELQDKIAQSQASAKARINAIKEALADDVKDCQALIDYYLTGLDKFASEHREDFAPAKSKQLNYGRIGWRKSTKVRVKKATLELVKKLLPARLQKKLIKVKETVSRDAVKELTDEQIAAIGARVEEKDVFFAEPAALEAADYPKENDDT